MSETRSATWWSARAAHASPASSMMRDRLQDLRDRLVARHLHQLEDVTFRIVAVDEPRRVRPAADVVDLEPAAPAGRLDPRERRRDVRRP